MGVPEKRSFWDDYSKKYGGLEFSATGTSEMVGKISSRSSVLGITVMVPNSLGPAELLIHYGTENKKTTTYHDWQMVKKYRVLH